MNAGQTSSTPKKLVSQLLLEEADLRDVVEEFVGGLSERIAAIRQAYERLEWETLIMLAHRLKGAGGSYGYPELSRVGAMMEEHFRAHRSDGFGQWMRELTELTAAAQAGLVN